MSTAHASAASPHPLASLPFAELDAPEGGPPPPTPTRCHALWDKYAMLDNVRVHSTLVADLAVAVARLARRKKPELNIAAIRACALLHDIAKTYTIRHGGSHAQLGASWVIAETGNRAIAQGVLLHVYWPWAIHSGNVCSLPFFIIYADKRVMHDRCVTLEERFDDLLVRYGDTEAHRASIRASYEQGKIIENALSAQTGVDLNAHTLDRGRLVQRA